MSLSHQVNKGRLLKKNINLIIYVEQTKEFIDNSLIKNSLVNIYFF